MNKIRFLILIRFSLNYLLRELDIEPILPVTYTIKSVWKIYSGKGKLLKERLEINCMGNCNMGRWEAQKEH